MSWLATATLTTLALTASPGDLVLGRLLPAARAASLSGEHQVGYRVTSCQPEIELTESLGHPDGRWRMELSIKLRGPGSSPRQEGSLGVWQRLGTVTVGVGGTWYSNPGKPSDLWVTAKVPWERP